MPKHSGTGEVVDPRMSGGEQFMPSGEPEKLQPHKSANIPADAPGNEAAEDMQRVSRGVSEFADTSGFMSQEQSAEKKQDLIDSGVPESSGQIGVRATY